MVVRLGGSVLLGAGVLWACAAVAADGDLDAAFGTSGESLAFANGAAASAVLVQNDGKVVLAGISAGSSGVGVARFLADGTPDTGFGNSGLCTIDRPSGGDSFLGRAAAALDASGRIVLGVTAAFGTNSYMYVVRLTGACQLDATFNHSGTLLINRGPSAPGDSVAAISAFADPQAAAADSWIYVAGATQDVSGSGSKLLAVIPLHADGSYITDTVADGVVGNDSFLAGSSGGLTFAHFYHSADPGGSGYDAASALARRWYPATATELLAVAGNVFSVSCTGGGCGSSAVPHFATIVELDHYLQPVASFGASGRSEFGFGGTVSQAFAVTLDDANRVVAAGLTGGASINASDMGVARILATGFYDTTFAGTGYQFINFDEASGQFSSSAQALLIQHDGRIVLGGYAVNADGADFALVRLLASGGRDAPFTGGTTVSGARKYEFNGTAGNYLAYALAFTAGEKLLLAGQVGVANASFGVLQALNDRVFGDGAEAPAYLPRIP